MRWIQFRIRFLPVLVFVCMVGLIAYLWEQELTPTHIVGEVYAEVGEVVAPESGIVSLIAKGLFENVREGDLIARIEPIPPAMVESKLRVLQAEMELTRVGGFGVLLDQERNLLNQKELYHDWLAARARAAVLVINSRQSQLDLERAEKLFTSGSIPQSELENVTAQRDALIEEKKGTQELVDALESSLAEFMSYAEDSVGNVRDAIRNSALRFQEAQLRQLELELQAIDVFAPLSGVITALHIQAGTFSTVGQSIAVIRSTQSQHIIGYVRQPAGILPQAGDAIEVVTRGSQRKSGLASVLSVGPQYEPLGPAFQSSFAETEERALPLLISMPAQLAIRPGEVVDLRIVDSRR
ncbi:MAG: hypothetical protein EA353_06360 [Puniceicoccaceae bacterium]|nr:MAG: hypothetical protein EA353_06360 [Puniceicoccaceae bacterium]